MKTTLLTVLLCSLLYLLSITLKGQSGTFTVYLPKIGYPPAEEGQGWNGNQPKVWGAFDGDALDDSIIIPNGRPIYALIVSGYAQNGNFDELLVYKFARVLMEHGAYVHYAWWNNLLAPYMERPLHFDQSYPGNLFKDFTNFTTVEQANEKALPGEDYQFVEDAKLLLSAIRQHNPDAMIIVVGHSMGGGAIVHLASPWNTDELIDILAPIDPVGNRNYPWATVRPTDYDYNWTRWRITRDKFLGYKAEDQNCAPTGSWLAKYDVARDLTPLLCRPPTIHQATTLTFESNIVHLFYRYQKEALFPFDYNTDYHFGHTPPPGFTEQDEQTYTPVTTEFCGFNQRCDDPGGWPENNPLLAQCCPTGDGVGWPFDGHGEIVGYRGPILGGPVPLGVRVRTSPNCGNQCQNQIWPERSKINGVWSNGNTTLRRTYLENLETLPVGSTWEHRPTNPDLCLVSDGLIMLFNRITSQWTQQLSGTSKQLRSVFFTDENTGWVVGDDGLIKHTTDGGNTWNLQPSGTSKNITDVFFTDASTGWIVGSYGLIKNTINGGNTWNLQPSGTSKLINAVYFTDANTGWVVGDDGLIKHTTDGGTTWLLQSTPTIKRLTDVHFSNSNTGCAVGYGGVILKTTNGGNTWTQQPSGTSKNIFAVYFIDANTGWVVGYTGLIKHTTDGGITWDLQITGRPNNLNNVCFTDANTGWAVGSEGLILHTSNGGILTGVNKIYEMPSDCKLSQNYPNPFSSSTTIRYSLTKTSKVVIKIYDLMGQEIAKLVNEENPAGSYEVNFNASGLSNGIYYYKLESNGHTQTKKMILMK